MATWHVTALHCTALHSTQSAATATRPFRSVRSARLLTTPAARIAVHPSIDDMLRGRSPVVCVRMRWAALEERMTQRSAAPLSHSDPLCAVLSLRSTSSPSPDTYPHPKVGRPMLATPSLSGLGAAPTAARQLGVFEPLNDTARQLPHGQTGRQTSAEPQPRSTALLPRASHACGPVRLHGNSAATSVQWLIRFRRCCCLSPPLNLLH